jgi:hypothetical protein
LTQAKHGSSWTQPPSASLTKTFREDLRNQQAAFTSAAESDERIAALYGAIRASIIQLQAPSGVGQLFASTVDRAAAGGQAGGQAPSLLDLGVEQEEAEERDKTELRTLVGEVEERLGRLHRLKKERTDALKELKELVSRCDRAIWHISSWTDLALIHVTRPRRSRTTTSRNSSCSTAGPGPTASRPFLRPSLRSSSRSKPERRRRSSTSGRQSRSSASGWTGSVDSPARQK